MKHIARMATTHTIERNSIRVKLTKEALESGANPNAKEAIPIIPNHDFFCLPFGKATDSWVEPYGDEHAFMQVIDCGYRVRVGKTRNSDVELIFIDFEDSPQPFKKNYSNEERGMFAVSVDLVNFASVESFEDFQKDLALEDDEIECQVQRRHSLIPEPLIEFVISNLHLSVALAVGVWLLGRMEKFIRYTVDETSKKVADDISEAISSKIKGILRMYQKHQAEDDRPIVLKLVIPGDRDIILLSRVEDVGDFPPIDLALLVSEMEKYGDVLQCAQEATFARTEDGDWEFLFLKTQTGEVIGTLSCYERTMTSVAETIKQAKENDSDGQ